MTKTNGVLPIERVSSVHKGVLLAFQSNARIGPRTLLCKVLSNSRVSWLFTSSPQNRSLGSAGNEYSERNDSQHLFLHRNGVIAELQGLVRLLLG